MTIKFANIIKKSCTNGMVDSITYRRGFTLAEVLITLAIIGIVAALTIPALMKNWQDVQYKSAYKKAYSIASQVVTSCSGDGSFVQRSSWTDAENNTTNWNAFKEKFRIAKFCDGSTIKLSECWDMDGEKYNTSTAPIDSDPGFIDASGMSWVQGSSEGVGVGVTTGDVFVDTNGFKKPNKFGRDRFRLAFVTHDDSLGTAGLPVKVWVNQDFTEYSPDWCHYPPCYYSSWLYK